jgi:hypothetical protein
MRQPPRRIDEVTPGYYRYRRVAKGPWLPAFVSIEHGMIFITEADNVLRVGISEKTYEDLVVNAVVNGEASHNSLLRVVWWGERISLEEHDHLVRMIAWAKEHMPEHPLCHPDEPVRPMAVPVKALF